MLRPATAGARKPTAADRVRVQYEGKLAATGSVFDSSYARGQPAEFAHDPAMLREHATEGVLLMLFVRRAQLLELLELLSHFLVLRVALGRLE